MITVSQSKAKTWLTCKFKYHLKHVERLQRKKIRRPLQFGRIMHDLIEVDLDGGDPLEKLEEIEAKDAKLFDEEIEEYGNIIDDIQVIFEAYRDYWRKDPLKPIPVEGKNSEHAFEIEILDGVFFNGRIDYLCKTNKLNWLGEHKTFGSLPNDDHRWRDLQSCVYFRAVEMMGWIGKKHLDGVCWNYINSKAPNEPKILKNGEMSAANTVTLPAVVRRVAKREGLSLDDENVAIQLERSEERCHDYFKRIYTPINEDVVKFTWNGFVDTARDIAENHGKVDSMTTGRHCDWCEFDPVCRARIMNQDIDFVKEHQFEVKPDGNSSEETTAKKETRKKKPAARKKEPSKRRTRQATGSKRG